MDVKYERGYEYTVNSRDHATLIKIVQYVSKHEPEGVFGDAARKLLQDMLCSEEVKL